MKANDDMHPSGNGVIGDGAQVCQLVSMVKLRSRDIEPVRIGYPLVAYDQSEEDLTGRDSKGINAVLGEQVHIGGGVPSGVMIFENRSTNGFTLASAEGPLVGILGWDNIGSVTLLDLEPRSYDIRSWSIENIGHCLPRLTPFAL